MARQKSSPRRNATRRGKQASNTKQAPRTVTTLLIGIGIGVFATLLTQLYLGSGPQGLRDNLASASSQIGNNSSASKESVATKPAVKAPTKPKRPAPRFDFYEILEKDEVKVDVSASPQVKSLSSDQEYILQVASFRKEDDADRLRAELILLNLDAKSQKAVLDSGDVWFRVLVGPFANQSKVASARATLLSNKHDALLLKRKK